MKRLGPALRVVLGCQEPKALRRAMDLRAAGGDRGASGGGGKTATKMARELADALDDIAAFLGADVAAVIPPPTTSTGATIATSTMKNWRCFTCEREVISGMAPAG